MEADGKDFSYDDLYCGTEFIIPLTDIKWAKCKLCGRELSQVMAWPYLPYCSEMCKQVAAREG